MYVKRSDYCCMDDDDDDDNDDDDEKIAQSRCYHGKLYKISKIFRHGKSSCQSLPKLASSLI